MLNPPILIRPFQPTDQDACHALVLAGLEEHWGWLDPTLNPDLNDIQTAYADGLFLTAWPGPELAGPGAVMPDWQKAELIGTGALLPAGPGCFQVVRMSVSRTWRGQGLGRLILACIEEHARAAGAVRLVLETTETWTEVVRFYLNCGYHITHTQDGDVYFEKEIAPVPSRDQSGEASSNSRPERKDQNE